MRDISEGPHILGEHDIFTDRENVSWVALIIFFVVFMVILLFVVARL